MRIDKESYNYDKNGRNYPNYRRTDPRIAKYVFDAIGTSKTVLNIGAGTGSYEPDNRYVIAVEPSKIMRSNRLKMNKFPAVIGTVESLPFDDKSFDVSMAIATIHHWSDWKKGIQEMIRVTKQKVLILTGDPDLIDNFWTAHYFPQLLEIEKKRLISIQDLVNVLDCKSNVTTIPVPFDCTDGFQDAYYGRPEEFLKKEVRLSQSAWSFLEKGLEEQYINDLSSDLESGEWDKKYGFYRKMPEFSGALKLIEAFVSLN